MTGLFETARNAIAREFERFRNRDFLEATMAAAALIAWADGEVNISELTMLDQALDTVQELKLYDPHEAVDLYREYLDALRNDEPGARQRAVDAVGQIAGDAHAAEVLLKVCVAIGKSDDEFSVAERAVIGSLCRTLRVDLSVAGL